MYALVVGLVALALGAILGPHGTEAGHDSTNTLAFEPIDGATHPDASGDGVIAYRGGDDLESRWTVQLQFRGLEPGVRYVAVIQGRFGATGTPEAGEFTGLCTVQASETGEGGCWWYLVQMQRVGVVQLRRDAVDGAPLLQATRDEAGPGSITSVPNAYSPLATPAVGSPVALPIASPVR